MIDHISFRVRDLDASVAFYKAALAPLGYSVLMAFPGIAGLGRNDKPDLWIGSGEADYWPAGSVVGASPLHIAIAADDKASVDAFYAAAIAAGAVDHGAPGMRPQYHRGYYGAFVVDLNGHNLEAVCHNAG